MNAAPSLLELQQSFAGAVLGTGRVPDGWIAGNGFDPQARMQIYCNLILNNHAAALRTAYPAVLKLVGENFFDAAAAGYLHACGSDSGNLQDYGAAFPEFLSRMPEAAGLAYLPDVARLEWARQESFLAADAAPLEPSALAGVADDKQNNLRFALHPSVHLFESSYPMLDIWGFCQRNSDARLSLGNTGQRILIWRTDTQIAMQALTAAQYAFTDSLMKQDTLDSAQTRASGLGTDFDVGAFLCWLFSEKLISDYSLVEGSSDLFVAPARSRLSPE